MPKHLCLKAAQYLKSELFEAPDIQQQKVRETLHRGGFSDAASSGRFRPRTNENRLEPILQLRYIFNVYHSSGIPV